MRPPNKMSWLFWEQDIRRLHVQRDANYILARILEHGSLEEVRWAMGKYGPERIHRFFREVGHPEMSDRTLRFWRAFFKADDEQWAAPPSWRRDSSIPWPP
jgi:hypothetical protein